MNEKSRSESEEKTEVERSARLEDIATKEGKRLRVEITNRRLAD
jgi:hypothetical protein